MAPIRLLELRNTYKWGGGPDKTILLSAARHNREQVEVVVVYIRDVRDHEFRIADKARRIGKLNGIFAPVSPGTHPRSG